MFTLSYIFCIIAFGVLEGHCDSNIPQQFHYVPEPGNFYSWTIPPPIQHPQANQDFPEKPTNTDPPNQSTPKQLGGHGHPLFNRRYSFEQLTLPNEFLMAPSDPQRPSAPVFHQLYPVNCDGTMTDCPNGNNNQQKDNIVSVQASPDQWSAPRQPVNWPTSYGGGVGFLFFVPESASHLPTEQLILQQLALHRTQLPFDISINCKDTAFGCHGNAGPAEVPTAIENVFNRNHGENVNYASLPYVKNVNSSGQQRKWRTIGELLVQQQHQHQQQQQQLQEQYQHQQQYQ